MAENGHYSLMIHGGAGTLESLKDPKTASRYRQSIHRILEHGREVLESGGSALQTVATCATLLEDDPLFNAGRGSVLNELGKVEMDAAIMDGRDLSAGAVAAVQNIANPIQLARQIMSKSEHVMLIAEGALRFADQCGIEQTQDNYFYTPERIAQFEQARLKNKIALDHDETDREDEAQKYGTIGAIARDIAGNLAAATSTGGMVNKSMGRVGDSPIVGAGVYADNETCAVSATGYGEDFMRTLIGKTISDLMLMKTLDGAQATAAGIDYFKRKVQGRGGVIVVDRNGQCSRGLTTKKLIHGWIEKSAESMVGFD
ncbi:MAG: isoaspartyl peptidase/L-asparaginase family protein [Candidatus Thiodiazotropha lotti]|nr:isoaspartyl peptidase/L-asparaginase family protein [Candidatus Thiodiazotropha lotti]